MRRSIAIAAGLAAALALVACGDDDEAGSGSSSDYCTLIVSIYEKFDVIDATLSSSDSSPADAEAAINDVKSMIAQLRSAAPAEIKADVEAMATATLRMFEILAEYDYDEMVTDTAPESAEMLELFNSAEYEAASERLNDYEDATCDIAP